jgi:hypothetical protein
MAKKKTDKVFKSFENDSVEIIDEKAIVNIKVSTTFFQRLQMVYMSLIKDKKSEDLEKFLDEVKQQKISSEENYNIETLLIILTEFQKNAKAEGFTKIISSEEFKKITEERIQKIKENQQS